MEIRDRSFLVTGGASGLGAACARMFIAAGGSAVIADVDEARGAQLAAEFGSGALFVPTDVADPAAVDRAVAAAERCGRFAGAVACAGIAPAAKLVGREGPHDAALFERVVRINLLGTFHLLRAAGAALQQVEPTTEGERGVIVCTSSIAAFDGQIGQTAYAAAKGGVAAMILPAAREFARFGVRVVGIAPGIFETPLVAGMTAEVRASLASQVPFPPRFGRPEEFASLVRHVFENSMLNGEVVRLDGAVRLGPR